MVMQAHLDTAVTLAELLVHSVIPQLPALPKLGPLHEAVSIQHQLLVCSLPYVLAVRSLLNQASQVRYNSTFSTVPVFVRERLRHISQAHRAVLLSDMRFTHYNDHGSSS